MRVYIIFIILLQNYEKPYMSIIVAFSGSDCVLIILFQRYGTKVGLFEGNFFWLGQYDNPNIHNGRTTNTMLMKLNEIPKELV